MKNMATVMRIARSIRHSAEKYEEFDPDLNGWCAVTSNVLFAELCRRGIRSRLTWNEGHCFLTYGRYLIDITATQFDSSLPKVVKRLRTPYHDDISWWDEEDSVSTLTSRKSNGDWASGAGHHYIEWQNKIRAHVKTLK